MTLMESLHSVNPGMPVIILTGHASVEGAVEAMKRGAYTYLTKPFDPRELILQIARALESRQLATENVRLKGLLREKYDFANIIAKSDKMQRVLEAVSRIAKTDSTVYIHGESGTGKELIARAIHLASDARTERSLRSIAPRFPRLCLKASCLDTRRAHSRAQPHDQRHVHAGQRGNDFFGRNRRHAAFLVQVKLLRALEERQFYPVGGDKPVQVDVRVIVATKKDLVEEVRKETFREDLFYRIHVISDHLAAAPGSERRHSLSRRSSFKKNLRSTKKEGERPHSEGDGEAYAARLARQCARTGKCPGVRGNDDPARRDQR